MTKDEALRMALGAAYLAGFNASGEGYNGEYPFGDKKQNPEQDAVWLKDRDNAIREVLAQPEFTKHEVVSAEDWSEWVCPDPQSYLMKCCDCGLLHEAQFKVVRYKSEDEREECDPVNDPNVQAVFRMRRSEEWTPKDTAYRPGGLAQPEAKDTIQSVDSSTERKAD